ncbi:protein WEAK CHLOROPLAST MOVEMENT UNDER BLUE LIGHT 1-like [Actinidia eriantha]|uniref:protein WEAK CHLOROPLAST MOVEMENT UNDER BLUE LIGHT 1-like n=1 Tax=Actinidia eriantha TaxID=165200 RepID=UPI0025905C18|nr:protein WEAK CHLOROPLAST MOVEMENT UNDER BLUE LIGHT 1-like [Actinidia eriantha]
MESGNETRMVSQSYSYRAKDLDESCNNILKIKMSELQKTKEELKRAKDEATQSFLDSKTLVDHLEKLQSNVAATKSRINMLTIVGSELESQLEMIDSSIRSKKEDEVKIRTTINEMNQDLDQTRVEMEQIKLEKDEERRARSELKQVLRLKRQTLRALQLMLRAVRLESEAFGSSAGDALHYINHSEMDNTTVQLTQEEYHELTRRAKEETSLADWRVSVSTEQRLVAKTSRDSTMRRLKELHTDKKLRRRKMKERVDGNITRDAEQDSRLKVGAPVDSRQIAFPKARAKLMAESSSQGKPRQQLRKSRNNKKLVKKRKPSFCAQINTCLVRTISGLCG